MKNRDIDDLLERAFSGSPPGQAFRARVLLESTAALARVRQSHSRWRLAALSAAAVFIAVASFLLGRSSVTSRGPLPASGPGVVIEGGSVSVPAELVTLLKAARLFEQLGMEDRVALAYDRAGRLMPPDDVGGVGDAEPAVAQRSRNLLDAVAALPDSPRKGEDARADATASTPSERQRAGVQTILAQSLGD